MFKKFSLSLILLSCFVQIFALADLGQTETLIVSASRTAETAVNSSAVVFSLDRKQLEQLHYESLSDAVTSVAAATINSNGTLGALQNANVNGMGATRTKVYVDGTLVSTSYDNCFDLNAIPLSIVERIEIITSGSAVGRQKVAAGGIINIVTKKSDGKPALDVSFENGSFIPRNKGFGALVDSQDFHAVYSNSFKNQNILLSIGGMRAKNAYSYKAKNYGISDWQLMNNADTWAADFTAGINGKIGTYTYSSKNIVRYQHLAVPGSCPYPTPHDYQNNLFLNSTNTMNTNRVNYALNYTYNPVLKYHTETSNDSHFKHNLSFKADTDFNITENISINSYAEAEFEIAKSTSLKNSELRFFPQAGFSSAIIFGNLVLYPTADIGFATDMKKWIPDASIGAEYTMAKNLTITGNLNFANRLPTFSDLYWPFTDYGWGFTYKGNPDLQPEKALSFDMGLEYKTDKTCASLDIFTKWINDQILTTDDFSMMDNIDNSLFIGFNANTEIAIKNLKASVGWFFNKSYNLTGNNSVSDDIAVANTRLNTLTFTATYSIGKFVLSSDGKYLGKYFNASGKEFDGAFIWNVGLNYNATDKLKLYMKIDNILNNQYQLSNGYPMPGMKTRIGGTWTII